MTDTTDQQAVTATVAQIDAECVADILTLAEALKLAGNDLASIRNGVWNDEPSDLGRLLSIAARHRLASVSSASAEGLALVPREPTVAMIEAARGMFPAPAYRAMLAASPELVPATNQAGEVDASDIGKVLAWAIIGQSVYGTSLLRPIIERLCRSALATQPATSQEGKGLVLVPRLATRAMVDAADSCIDAYSAWSAMVEASNAR